MCDHPTTEAFESLADGTKLTIQLESDDTPEMAGATVARIGDGFARPYLQEVSGRFCGTVTNDDGPNELVLEGELYRYEIQLPDIDWWGEECSECGEVGPPEEPCPTCESRVAQMAFTGGATPATRRPPHGNTAR
ncbi:hypothetical protein ACOZ4L_16685 (plasmid) [Haloplanus ruber]|uniref:Uncharacterized protein n=1 Tax=Haloplanus ruber TaxID=869892 RepID=A0ABD6D3D9_9EURY|nr:hypothetical protein [Haloplanus ruber]